MSSAGLIIALVAIAAFDLLLVGVLVRPILRARRRARPSAAGRPMPGPADLRGLAELADDVAAGQGLSVHAYDRVVRITSWAYLLSTAVVVWVSGLWVETQSALLLVLALGGVFVVVAHDLLPGDTLGRAKYLVEGTVAIVIVTLIVLLTGGPRSPFFFAYALVVAGAALVVQSQVALRLVAIAMFGYIFAALVDVTPDALTVAEIGINLVALVLLTYVAMVVAGEQRRIRDSAVRLSTTDALTGLANRAYLVAALEREIERAARYGGGFCLLMADLDDLKVLNDTYGHRLGDRVLIAIAQVIRDGVRRIDTPGRLGGDEFLVLLPETDPAGAWVVAEKIRVGVAGLGPMERGAPIRVRISIGLVSWPGDGTTVEQLMNAADEAMYRAKRLGKRRAGSWVGRGVMAREGDDLPLGPARSPAARAGRAASVDPPIRFPGERAG